MECLRLISGNTQTRFLNGLDAKGQQLPGLVKNNLRFYLFLGFWVLTCDEKDLGLGLNLGCFPQLFPD